MVVLTFVGNINKLTNRELIEIKKLPYLNGINKSDFNLKLRDEYKKFLEWYNYD